MRIRRKTNQCLNCGYTLDRVYNYCPNCGQENDDNNVSIGTLLGDFFNTYFALDSKLAKTIKPFFFSPGHLTNRYAEGKRVSYAHPLRLYLIISLFFFFIFTVVGKKVISEDDKDKPVIQTSYSIKDIDGLDKETLNQLDSILSDNTVKAIAKDIRGDDDLEKFQKALNNNLTDQDKEALRDAFGNNTLALLGLDSTRVDSLDTIADVENTATKNKPEYIKNENSGFILGRLDWELINELKHNREYTDSEILDSMKLGELSGFDRHLAMQSIRVQRADKEQFVEYMLKNIPLMMLLLIPIFALILKLLYVRRKQLYIKHLIHALHLHTFSYFFYGISLLVIFFMMEGSSLRNNLALLSFILVSTYAYISFLKVYKQHWFKTFIKFNVAGFIYIFFIMIFFLAEMVISMLLF
ncbi:hypothetical protein C900_04415 [Fulvivirga imtechensis AK7]|uniref:DUF3667 domain-containing protein n=1 Tax=Fulvivirga imtechensis AK7 TaxID=1237149 RepID=L8JMJ9_9BACT|nr:DUF3667 domain-containing protein [Fulvivirga imtechensis]ELR70045.1 hypothetical protein C900_04415 [Fulvivirga imtechensis AK7]